MKDKLEYKKLKQDKEALLTNPLNFWRNNKK